MTIEDLIKAKESVLNNTLKVPNYYGDIALSDLVVKLVNFVVGTQQAADAHTTRIQQLEKQVASKVAVNEHVLGSIKTVLERQQEAITNLTTQTTMLEGIALQVSGHVTYNQIIKLTKPISIALLWPR